MSQRFITHPDTLNDLFPWDFRPKLRTETPFPLYVVYTVPDTPHLTISFNKVSSVVTISVLATGPKVRGLKPGRGDKFSRTIKIRITTSFGGEVKPSVPCRKILRHSKELYEYVRYISWQNPLFSSPVSSWFATRWLSTGRIARESWWTNQDFSPVDIISPRFSLLTYHLRDEQ
jgi:hypothetical protein